MPTRRSTASPTPRAAVPSPNQVEVVLAELRRRIGGTYTVSQLADAYTDADRWTHVALGEAEEVPAWWPETLTLVQAAAFARYELGAVDYAP